MNDAVNKVDRELGWDDSIENDSSFILLPAGDYDFEVISFERARHPGSAKLPACNKAVVTLEVGGDQAAARLQHNLFLHTKTEGMLCAFFTAIGQRKPGEPLKPKWEQIVGSTGRCKLGILEWTSTKTGEKMQSNEVKKFYEPDGKTQVAAAPKTYQEGRF